MFDGNFRSGFDRLVGPIGRGLGRAGISPDFITGVGVAMAAACAVAIGTERYYLAVFLLILTGLPDALDGAVAKATGSAGPRGAFLDSVSDRLSDGLLLAGFAWNLAGSDNPRLSIIPFGVFLAASLVSYERAKAESLGYDAKGGLMERAERMVSLGIALIFWPFLAEILAVILVLTAGTAVARFVKVWRQASGRAVDPGKEAMRRARRRNARRMLEFRERAQARSLARRDRIKR